MLNSLSSSAKPDILMVLKYKIHIIIVKLGQAGLLTILRYKFDISLAITRKAGRELTMQDIPGEWFVKLSQVWYSHGIKI